MPLPKELSLISEKSLHQAAEPHLLAYCPSMELLALGSKDQQVLIYRLNGQRVYGATQKGTALTVDRISWKPNGQLLAIAWSDGVVRLVGAESSKTVHQIATGLEKSGITWMGWVSNLTAKNAVHVVKAGSSWKDLVQTLHDVDSEERKPLDLPRDLSLIDVEASMPKLSVLPAGATAEDIFSTRASIDGLFRPFDPKDNDSVDIMIVGTKDGRLLLSIYDSFVIGSLPSPLVAASQTEEHKSKLIGHASNMLYSTHALLFGPSQPKEDPALYFVPMDLRFVCVSSEYLPLLASKSTALQNLLRYIDQVQILMGVEWEATQDLPRRFLRNINETLAEKKPGSDIVQALYHSVSTGHTFPAVREWLVDELNERGHKRWDKTVIGGLENLRKLVHEDMVPALERCNVILSRLSGISKYQGSNDTMGFSSHQIHLVMDTVACLNLVCAKILAYTVDELEMFTAFSAWIRYEIDRLASDASSSSPDNDVVEKESIIDYSKVLLYIQTALTNSQLRAFFKDPQSKDEKHDWTEAQKGLPLFQIVDQDLQRNEAGLTHSHLTQIDVLCKHLDRQATAVFHQIAEAEKRNVHFGQPVSLGQDTKGQKIMRLCPERSSSCLVYIALSHGRKITMYSIKLNIEKGISTQNPIRQAVLEFGSRDILDIAFADDNTLMALCHVEGKAPKLIGIEFQKGLRYQHRSAENPTASNVSTIESITAFTTTYAFPEGVGFVPDRVTVNEPSGRKGEKGKLGPRICVLDRSRLHYRIFTLREMQTTATGKGEGIDDEDVQMTQE